MSDSSAGTFVLEPLAIPVGTLPSFLNKKKMLISSTPKKIETKSKPAATTTTLSVKESQKVTIMQKINFPSDLSHCSVVKDLLPNSDGTLVVASIEVPDGEEPESVYGALLSYYVVVQSGVIQLSPQNTCLRTINRREDLPVSFCLIPPDSGEALLVMVLRSGNVWILKVGDLSTLSSIERPGDDVAITSVSYISSKICMIILKIK